jgi:hypothetical protein
MTTLFVVAPECLSVYLRLEEARGRMGDVRLIPDRRRRPRRDRPDAVAVERREGDRRARPEVDEQVRALGWSLVRLAGPAEPSA